MTPYFSLATSHHLEIFNDDCTKGSREDIIFTCKFTCKMPTSIYLTTAPQTTTTWMNASTSTPHTTSTTTDNPCRITDSGTITVCWCSMIERRKIERKNLVRNIRHLYFIFNNKPSTLKQSKHLSILQKATYYCTSRNE